MPPMVEWIKKNHGVFIEYCLHSNKNKYYTTISSCNTDKSHKHNIEVKKFIFHLYKFKKTGKGK